MSLEGKVALVTGSTSGIGLAIARAFAGAGCSVMLNGLGEAAALHKLAGELAGESGMKVACHRRRHDQAGRDRRPRGQDARRRWAASTSWSTTPASSMSRRIEKFPAEKWDAIIAINLSASFHTIRAALPAMKDEGLGPHHQHRQHARPRRLDPQDQPTSPPSTAPIGLTKVMGIECADTGVTCNAICPGFVLTPLALAQIETKAKADGIGIERGEPPADRREAAAGPASPRRSRSRGWPCFWRPTPRPTCRAPLWCPTAAGPHNRGSTVVEAKFLKPDTLALHAGPAPDPRPARAPCRSTRRPPSCSATPSTPRPVQPGASPATSTPASPTRPSRCSRSASRRSRGARARSRASGQAALHLAIATLMGAGGHIVASTLALRRLAQPAALHPAALRHRRPPSSIRATMTASRRRSGRRRGWCSARRSAIPGSTCSTSRPSPTIAHEAKIAAAGRLHLHHAVAVPAVRARRRPRLPLGDQVPRRPRHRDRRRARRRRPLRLGRLGQVPDADRALRRLSRHGLRRGVRPAAFIMRARPEGLRDFGACMAPQTAFYLLQGIETLPLRMARHVENARKVVGFLAGQSGGRAHRLARAARPSRPCAGQAAAAQGRRLDLQLRHQGRPRGGPALHRGAAAVLAPRQRRRRQVAGDPSGLDHALPARRGGARRRRASARA